MPHLSLVLCLAASLGLAAATKSQATEASAPALPDSPLKTLLGQLAQKSAPAGPAPGKAELVRPELGFKPRRRWLLLPDLARQLGDDDEQRATIRTLLEAGAVEARKALAAEGADNDVGAAATLFVSQLWQFARNSELSEAHVDVLHAQVVATLATPEVAKMSDAEKQRFWEYCIGFPIFVAGMAELTDDAKHTAALRTAAGLGFEAVLGVGVRQVEIGAAGLTAKAAPAPKLPATGPAIPGIDYTAPPGWTRETVGANVIFRATLGDVDDKGQLDPNNTASHQATIGFTPILGARQGPTTLFEQIWRDQFAPFELGDTVVHYRARLPSQLVVLYMGRFFARPNTPKTHGNPMTYGALWLIDLGDNRFQPMVALIEPRDPGIGMDSFRESQALRALSFPLAAVLDSIRPAKGAPPYPAGGFFAAEDLRGTWVTSSSAFGGHYVNTATGGSAGVAVTSSGGHFYLRNDGTYEYAFAYYAANPQLGNSSGSTRHGGRYTLDGDIVLVEPAKPINYKFTCCAVGVGVRQTPQGPRRMLVTVSARNDGVFLAPHLIANWDGYQGTMNWYMEDPTVR